MKKILILGLALFAGAAVHAANERFSVPVGDNNVADPGLRSAGVNNLILVNSTSPALATDADGNTMTRGFVYFVIVPSSETVSATNSHFLVMRDTATANLTSTVMAPRIWATQIATGSKSQVLKFDPPIPFYNGLSLNLGAAATTPVTGYEFAVGVRHATRQ